ncbi:MAG: cytidylyltransferase domain-containing protein [Promethearchaeota archaeon]
MLAIIIQARMGSSRFKGKVLKKIYKNKTILDIILNNLKILNCKIIIATTNKESDREIVKIALKHKLDYYCGSESNVLKRYIDAAHEFNISKIVRVCSDNIFIQKDFILHLIRSRDLNYDYMSYKIGKKNVILTHWGFFGEYVTLDALKKVQEKTKNKFYLEHVTNYIYTHPNNFNIKFWDVPPELMRDDIRLTIDTAEDYQICKKIVSYLKENKLEWHYNKILEYLENNPDLNERIKKNIERIQQS